MLPILALLVEPLIARRLQRRENAVHELLARIRFFSSALDDRLDFSGVHHFPKWIEDASNQVLNLDPSNSYATRIKGRIPEFRARAAEIVAMRRPVSTDSDTPL